MNLRTLLDNLEKISTLDSSKIEIFDNFHLEVNNNTLIETKVIGFMPDGIILHGDEYALELLHKNPNTQLYEAEYKGRKVTLNKPMQGDVAKSKVYVKGPTGKIVKVNFGDPNMRIKKSNPARRKSFRARHKCDSPGPKWKARYWSCKMW